MSDHNGTEQTRFDTERNLRCVISDMKQENKDLLARAEQAERELAALRESARWPLIELGSGQILVGEGHQEGRPRLVFTQGGTGTVGEDVPAELFAELAESPLAVVTFDNEASLDVVVGKLEIIRGNLPAPPTTTDTTGRE